MPIDTMEWLDLRDENIMFSPTLIERGLTPWECSKCPWWIEYPLGVVPKQELQLHAAFVKDNPTAVWPLSIDPHSNVEAMQGIQSTTKNTSIEKQTVHVDDDSLDEADVTPLIRKNSKDPMTATSSRSRASQSILDRPTLERQPIQWNIGREYHTCVDALLVDVAPIDNFARLSIREWFENSRSTLSQREYHRHGVPSSIAARLIFADFPTSMLVHGLHNPLQGVPLEIPDWNVFDVSLVMGVMEIARTHLADEGFLVTLCLAQDLGKILRHADKSALQLHRSWTLDTDGGYVHLQTREQVTDVTSGLFYHKNKAVPSYDRLAGQEVSPLLFPASRSCIIEGPLRALCDYTTVDGILIRGGAERSKTFFSWLLATFTQHEDYIINVFAGCGGLGAACSRESRHCLLLELDSFVYSECLLDLVCGPSLEGGD